MGLTGKEEEDEPVHDQNWPEHWHVEDLEPAAEKGDGDNSSGRVPELKLGQAANEGPELLVRLGRERANRSILHFIV